MVILILLFSVVFLAVLLAVKAGSRATPEMPAALCEDEELYSRALALLRTAPDASTATLQRRLRIGRPRAEGLLALLKQRGVVASAVSDTDRR
jgi:DNA segregation ATPase FtsK/SpoIIIE-like protein